MALADTFPEVLEKEADPQEEPLQYQDLREAFGIEESESFVPVAVKTKLGTLDLEMSGEDVDKLGLGPEDTIGNAYFDIWFGKKVEPDLKKFLKERKAQNIEELEPGLRGEIQDRVLENFRSHIGGEFTKEKERYAREAETTAKQKMMEARKHGQGQHFR